MCGFERCNNIFLKDTSQVSGELTSSTLFRSVHKTVLHYTPYVDITVGISRTQNYEIFHRVPACVARPVSRVFHEIFAFILKLCDSLTLHV